MRGDRSYWWNRTDGGLRHDLNEYTYLDLSGGYEFKKYDDAEVAAESDEDSVDGQFMFWRRITPQTAAHGEVGASMYAYESRAGLDRDFDSYLLAAGLDRVFSPEFRGGLTGGAQFSQYSDESLDDSTYPYGRINATLSPTAVYSIDASLGIGTRDSDVFPFASQEYTEFRLLLNIDPSPTYGLGLDGTIRDSRYDQDSLPANAAPTEDGNEITAFISGFGIWHINEQALMTLRQTYEDVDSDVEESYTKNTSSLEFNIDF